MEEQLPITPGSSELWRKFIDPFVWQKALQTFPREPWRFYIKPVGQFDQKHWSCFTGAVDWVWQKASSMREGNDITITLKDVLTVNALILDGNSANWKNSLRDYRPIFNRRSLAEIDAVYDNRSCFYKNQDSLMVRIDGFIREDYQSIDFFLVCRKLGKLNYRENTDEWLKLHKQFKSHLQQQTDGSSLAWNAYYLSNTDELIAQIEAILAWYNASAKKILSLSRDFKAQSNAVLELAVKMQRYLDICQFCLDGSSRTSKLIHDYIFLLFGYYPPNPVLYFYKDLPYANGTYIPLANALEIARLGWEQLSSTTIKAPEPDYQAAAPH